MKWEDLRNLKPSMILINKKKGNKIEIIEIGEDELKGKDTETKEIKAYKLSSVRVCFDIFEQVNNEQFEEIKEDKYEHIRAMRNMLLADVLSWGNIETKEAKLYTGIYVKEKINEEKEIKKLLCMLYKKTDRVMIQTRPYDGIDTDIIEMNIAKGYNGDFQFKIKKLEEMPELIRILKLIFEKISAELLEQVEGAK